MSPVRKISRPPDTELRRSTTAACMTPPDEHPLLVQASLSADVLLDEQRVLV
jgi:hypothetical protein